MDGESKEVEISELDRAEAAVVEAELLPGSTVFTGENGQPLPPDDQPDMETINRSLADIEAGLVKSPQELLAEVSRDGERYPPDIMPKLGPPFPDYATIAKRAQEKLDPFLRTKIVAFKGGPADGEERSHASMPADGLICFFQNNNGTPEQAVYKMQLKEIERTEEQRKAGTAIEWEWIAEYQGKRRYIPLGTVNGIRKGS